MDFHSSVPALFDVLHKNGVEYICIGSSNIGTDNKSLGSSFSIVLNPNKANQNKFIKCLTKLGVSRDDISNTDVYTTNIILHVGTPPVELRRESKCTAKDRLGKEQQIFPIDFHQLWKNKVKFPIKPKEYYLAPSPKDLNDGLVLENYLTNGIILRKKA